MLLVKKFLTFMIAFFLLGINVYAASACDVNEEASLKQKAANITANYEVVSNLVTDGEDEGIEEYFNISIYNLSEEFYVVVKRDKKETEEEERIVNKVYNYSDTQNGVLTFKWENNEEVTNWTIEVYSSNKTSCTGESYKKLYLTTPHFNNFSYLAMCDDLEEFYLCKRYVTFDEIDSETFYKKLESFQAGKINDKGEETKSKTTFFDNVFKFIDENKWIIIGVGAGIVAIITPVVVIKKRKSRKK